MKITKLILKLRESFLSEKTIDRPYDINNGYCVEFAEKLESLLEGSFTFEIRNFITEQRNGCYEWVKDENGKYLCEYWGGVDLSLEPELFDYHAWVYYEGKHYDAECPEGVESFIELPLFQRRLNKK